MTTFCNFFLNTWDASTTTTLPTSGADIATLKQTTGVPAAESVAIAHVVTSNTAGASPGVPSFTDNMGLTWTAIHSLTYDGTNGTRHSAYWAKVPFMGRLYVTCSLDGGSNVSLAHFQLFTIRGAHVTAPQDLNVDAIKTESHTSAATSSISGLSTTNADTLLVALYGSRVVGTAPGTPATFTGMYDRSAQLRIAAFTKQVTTTQSSIGVSVLNSSTSGSLIVFAVRPRTVLRKEITWLQGFEQYTPNEMFINTAGGMIDNNSQFSLPTQSGYSDIVPGRDGVGKALRVNGGTSSGDIQRLRSIYLGGFGVRNPNMTTSSGMAYDRLTDDDHIYIGFNIKIGTVVGSSATVHPNKAIVGFIQSTTTDQIVISYNLSTFKWGLKVGGMPGGLTSPALTTPDVLVTPDYDPYQRWVWCELHLYRHASLGRVEFWQESLPFKAGLQGGTAGKRGTAGGHKSRHRTWRTAGKPVQDQPEATLVKIFDYTGDTSFATLGFIDTFCVYGDNTGSSENLSCDLDDLVLSTGDRMRGPCYIRTIPPRSTVSNVNDFAGTVRPVASAEVTGTSVTTCSSVINVLAGELIVLSVHATNSTDTPPATTISSIVDSQGNSYTNIANVAYIDTAFTPDLQCRHAVYWARAASDGILTITATFGGTMSVISTHAVVVHTNDASPLDTNINSLKTESHNTSATSSVSGFTTDATAGLVIGVYASPRSGSETLTGFVEQTRRIQNGAVGDNTKQVFHSKVMSGAESGSTFTMSASSISGSLIVFCLKNAAYALDVFKSSANFSHNLYEVVDESGLDKNDYASAYTGNPHVVFDFNNEGVGYTPRTVWAVQTIAETHGYNDVDDAAQAQIQKCGVVSGSSEHLSVDQSSFTSNLLHRWVIATANYDPATKASWSYTAAKAAKASYLFPTLWYDFETTNRIYGQRRLMMITKQMLVSQMVGNGAGGVADTPGSPGYIGGNTEFISAPFTSCFHGIMEEIGPNGQSGMLHPINQGIMV